MIYIKLKYLFFTKVCNSLWCSPNPFFPVKLGKNLGVDASSAKCLEMVCKYCIYLATKPNQQIHVSEID